MMVGSFRSTDGLAIRAMGVGSGCWLTDELGDPRWLARQDQPHRFRPEQGSRHLLQVWADQQRHFTLGENVFLKIDSWRNFDHSQPIFGQLDDAAFGDVEDLLASLAAHLAGERDLRYFRDEFCDRAIGADPEPAMLDLDVLLASGEVAGKNDLGRTRDDVIEAAHTGGDVRARRQRGSVDIPRRRNLQKRQHRHVEPAALQQRELVDALQQRLRVKCAPKREPGRREAAHRALLDDPRDVVGVAFLEQHPRDGGGDSKAEVDDGIDLQLGSGPTCYHLFETELDGLDVIEVATYFSGQGGVVEGLRGLHLIGVDNDGVDEDPGYVDILSRKLGFGESLDLGDDDAAFVVCGVSLVECPEGAALFLVREVAVRVGGSGSDDRDVNVNRRVEEVVVAVDLHQLDEVVSDGVHLGALEPWVRVRA